MTKQIPSQLLSGGYINTDTTAITVTYDEVQYALSTGPLNGGFHHILALRNQGLNFEVSTEKELPGGSSSAYLAKEFTQIDLPINFCTAILTTASLERPIYSIVKQEDIIVEVIATAAIAKTAHRAGDGYQYNEKDGHFQDREAINLLVFTNQALTDGAMTKAIITITEAKTAALSQLGIKSLMSNGLATGGANDEIILTINTSGTVLSDASSFSLFGDTLAKAVTEAVTEVIKK